MIEDELKKDLTSEMDLERIFQKHIIDGKSYLFNELMGQPNQEYKLRHELAKALQININDAIIVGSAKLGFSIKDSTFNKFDHKFTKSGIPKDKSDIDIAVIHSGVFEKYSQTIYDLSRHFDKDWAREHWSSNHYYPSANGLFSDYAIYLAKGWFRPDFLPLIYLNEAPWKKFCDKWYGQLNRKISVGFYSNWFYLKHYQMDGLENLRIKLKGLQK